MCSGYTNVHYGYLRNEGFNGYAWSAVAASKLYTDAIVPSAYHLNFNATGVSHSYGPNYRWYGFPLRCLYNLYYLLYTSCAAGMLVLVLTVA